METPFTNYTPEAKNDTPIVTPFTFESPFLDPEQVVSVMPDESGQSLGFETKTQHVQSLQFDVDKAIRLNKKYEKELWSEQFAAIAKYFLAKGFSSQSLVMNDASFASAVARWQATVFSDKRSVDGIIGSGSWKVLRPSLGGTISGPTQTLSRWHQLIKNTVPCPAVPLLHGKETFSKMVDAIRSATNADHYIYILGWMLDVDFELIPGDPSTTLSSLLRNAVKRNVEIRALVWDNPFYTEAIDLAETTINALPNSALIKDNATYGSPGIKTLITKVKIAIENPPFPLDKVLGYSDAWEALKKRIKTIHLQNEGSHHEKVLVVKGIGGLVGFCGGIDINRNRIDGTDSRGRKYGIDKNGKSIVLHDVHCELRGHAAWVLLHRFIWRWQVYKSQQTGSILNPHLLLPLRGEKEPTPVFTFPVTNLAHVKILQTYNHPSNQSVKDRSIRETVKLAILNAKETIHIEDQYMISLEIADWLNRKLKEPGFRSVSILTQDDSIAKDDIQFPHQMRNKFIEHLCEGLTPYEKKQKVFISMLNPNSPLLAHHQVHSKLYVIDNELTIVGSANCSSRSMTNDSETAAVIFNDPGAVSSFTGTLTGKLNYDPLQHVLPYAPNTTVKDRDIEIVDDITHAVNNLAWYEKAALSITNLDDVLLQIISLMKDLKPFIIDVVDPDADGTIPQQELPDTLDEQYLYLQGNDNNETPFPTPFENLLVNNEQNIYGETLEEDPDWKEELKDQPSEFDNEQIISVLTIEGYEDVGNSGLPLLKADASTRKQPLSKNFTVGEFAQAGNGKYKWTYYRVDMDLIKELQTLREKIRRPIKIIDGYHPPKYFKDILKKPVQTNNPHISGRGIRISAPGMSSVELAKQAILFCSESTHIAVGETSVSLYVKYPPPRISSYIRNKGKKHRAMLVLQGAAIRHMSKPESATIPDEVLPAEFLDLLSPQNDLRLKYNSIQKAKESANTAFEVLNKSTAKDLQSTVTNSKGFLKLADDIKALAKNDAEKEFEKSLAGLDEPVKEELKAFRKKQLDELAESIHTDASKMSYLGKLQFLRSSIALLEDLDKIASIPEKKKKYDEFFAQNSLAVAYYGTDLFEVIAKTTLDTIRLGVGIGLVLSNSVEAQSNLLKISESLAKVAKGLVVFMEGIHIVKEVTTIIYSLATGRPIDWKSAVESIVKSTAIIVTTLRFGGGILSLVTAGYLYIQLIRDVLLMGGQAVYSIDLGGTLQALKEMNEEFKKVTENYLYAKYDLELITNKFGYSDSGLENNPTLYTKLKEDYYALGRKLEDFRQYTLELCQTTRSTENLYTSFPSIPMRIFPQPVVDQLGLIFQRIGNPEDFTYDYADALNDYYKLFYEGIVKCHLELRDIVEERLNRKAIRCVTLPSLRFSTKKSTINETINKLDAELSQERLFDQSLENNEWEAYEATENYEVEPLSATEIINDNEIAELMEQQAALAKVSSKTCEGRTCWAQEVLNRVQSTSLVLNNNLDEPTKKAIADFQTKNNLPVTLRIDAATERALLEADALQRNKGTVWQAAANAVITAAKTKLEDWTKRAVNNKPQYILDSYRDPRKVYAFVLHHMAFKRRSRKTGKYSDPESYLSTGAHFCILFDGRIVQLHPFSRMIWHGNCISPRSVAVEFEGNFPNVKGKWWIDKEAKVPDKDVPTQAQYEAGRFLASYLKIVLGTTTILAHRQSSKDRENDPGPDIWFNVGQWAVEKLGLSDGGPAFKCGDGNPILPEWRTWSSKTSTFTNKEYDNGQEWQNEMTENESTLYEPEVEDFYASEPEKDSFYDETDDLTKDWSKAVQLNRYYNKQLGWDQYYDKINDFLLPFSGLINVSLSEEALAQAVAEWQRQQGFAAKDCDGIIGPNTWRLLKPQIVTDTIATTVPTSGSATTLEIVPSVYSSEKVPAGFKAGSYKEWSGLDKKSTMRVDEAARLINQTIDLKTKGITNVDIDTFQRIANAETGGKIQNFYSYDRAIVSMGFRQFTFIHNNLHEWIRKAPLAFKRYGIEIDETLPPYTIVQGKYTYTVARIKGVANPEDLRWNGWAQRFYYAGLDYDIVVAEFLLAKEFFAREIGRLQAKFKTAPQQFAAFMKFYNQSGHTRAFFHELNNALPAYVPAVVAKAITKTEPGENADQFLQKFFEAAKQGWPDPDQAIRIFTNTKAGSQINENEMLDSELVDENVQDVFNESLATPDFESPEMENFTLAQKLSKMNDWAYLLRFKVPDAVVSKLRGRNMSIQYAHNESYSNDLNVDFYRLRIDRFPTFNGVRMTPQSLIKYIRLNINKLVDTSYCDFSPYSSVIDLPVWLSDDPTGAILKLDIKGPDNAAVVVSHAQPNGWRFSTVTTPDTGRHPVSGHREFFIGKEATTGGTYFIIKGLDMVSTGIAGMGFPFLGSYSYEQGDLLWRSFRQGLIGFINANGGAARQDITYAEQVEWRYVYYRYKNMLEEAFGKGAGSAENSPFVTFQVAEEV